MPSQSRCTACCAQHKESVSPADGGAHLNLHKLPSAFMANLEEGLARHVLHTRMCLMHELKQLVHDCLQKLPVIAQEARVLAHDIPERHMPQSRTAPSQGENHHSGQHFYRTPPCLRTPLGCNFGVCCVDVCMRSRLGLGLGSSYLVST